MARTLLWVPYVVPSLELLGEGELVLTATVPRQNLREVAADGSDGGRWLSRGSTVDRQPIYTPAGDRVVFSSSRSGNLDLWSLSLADGSLRRLTDDPAEDWDPAFSRDGRTLLWSSNRGGRFEVWAAEGDGRAARQLSRDGEDAENPTVTPDGWVVYASGHREKRGLWRMRLDGSDPRRLLGGVTARPEVSPDGRFVLFDTPTAEGQEVRVARLADATLLPFRIAVPFRNLPISGGLSSLPVALGRARWRPDGAAIAYVGLDAEGRVDLYEVPFREDVSEVDVAARRVLARSEGELITESHGWAPDGSRLLVSFVERAPNLVVAEGVPGVAGRRR
jgi:Tol biopolymer transport system component